MTKEEIKDWLQIKYPLTIVADRYGGGYSGGSFLAFPKDIPDLVEINELFDGNDIECLSFWADYTGIVGKGNTPNEAKFNLIENMNKLCT